MKSIVLRWHVALALIVGVAVFAAMTVSAFAHHPGEDRDGTVPQGPHQTACENQGEGGIDEAIENGGAVHCEEEEPEDPGAGN